MYRSFGENIKKYRILAGLSQQELAEKLGYKAKASISLIENGHCDVNTKMATKIAQALNVNVMDLMVLHGEEKKEEELMEFLPYMLKAQDWQLDAIRKILDMPKKTTEEIEK